MAPNDYPLLEAIKDQFREVIQEEDFGEEISKTIMRISPAMSSTAWGIVWTNK